jgi:hypothetical protein
MIVAFSAVDAQPRSVRFPFRWCGILLLMFVCMASTDAAQAADPDSDPQLKQIADAIRAWRESIVNIRVKFEKTFEGGHLLSKEAGERDVTLDRNGMDWIWTDSGKVTVHKFALRA